MNPSGARCWAVLILFLAIILATPAAEVTLVRLNAPHSAALASRSVATESSSSLVYSTYLGGAESNDVINGLAVDAAGNAYVPDTPPPRISPSHQAPTTRLHPEAS